MDRIAKSAEVRRSLEDVIEAAKDWALVNGLTMRTSARSAGIDNSSAKDRVEFVPFTLVPSEFPRAAYEATRGVQPLVNRLMHLVSRDAGFLRESLAGAARSDDFTRRLLELHDAVREEGSVQSVELGLLRADYMLEEEEGDWSDASERCKQVEVNTIASGQGWIGTACSRLHRYVLEEMDLAERVANMPENNPLEGLCRGMLEAWKLYKNPNAAILFIVEEHPGHIGDQRRHEYELRRLEPGVRVLRRSLGQLAGCASLSAPERRLLVDGREVGLVYLRSGYAPEQYPGEAEWGARLTLERSRAVKCPSIGMHLAGSKKVQERLAGDGCLERFLGTEESERMRGFFTGLYSLDANSTDTSPLESALLHPADYVLKPQREGGANNLFGPALKSKLESMLREDEEERAAWILMDRIAPAVSRNYMVRPGGKSNDKLVDVTSELGIFGLVLSDGERILVNEALGHTLRTKLAGCDEGGVSSGFGACDSPLLV